MAYLDSVTGLYPSLIIAPTALHSCRMNSRALRANFGGLRSWSGRGGVVPLAPSDLLFALGRDSADVRSGRNWRCSTVWRATVWAKNNTRCSPLWRKQVRNSWGIRNYWKNRNKIWEFWWSRRTSLREIGNGCLQLRIKTRDSSQSNNVF